MQNISIKRAINRRYSCVPDGQKSVVIQDSTFLASTPIKQTMISIVANSATCRPHICICYVNLEAECYL
jgi:hypothetical protein